MNTTERALSGKSASAASIFLQTAWVGRTHRAHSRRSSGQLSAETSNRSPRDFADRPALLTKHSICPKAVNIASTKRGRSPGSVRSFLMKERRARARIGCDTFGDRRIDRSVTDDVWPQTTTSKSRRVRAINALADPTHSARDGRDVSVEAGSGITIAPCGMRSRAASVPGSRMGAMSDSTTANPTCRTHRGGRSAATRRPSCGSISTHS
jgi:hypothetical protein